jgi:hypothetical protein
MLVRFSAVEAVNQAWAALAGTRAATVTEKLKDLNQRRRIVNAARTAIGDDELPLGVRTLGRLLDRDWFVDLVASPDDLRIRARAARVEAAQLDELCGPDVDDDTKRAWVVALAGSVWSISVRDATIVEAVQLAVLNRIDDTLVRVVDLGISTYDLVAQLVATSATQDAAEDQPRPLHNLPQRLFSSFVGRDAEVQQLHRLLRPHPESRHFIAIVDGIGGVGKTSLVSQVAHHYITHHRELPEAHRFDAVVWVSAKRDVLTADGIRQRRFELGELSDLLRAIGNVLGRSDLSRVLLVVDNLETVPDTELVTFCGRYPTRRRCSSRLANGSMSPTPSV